MCVCGAIFVLVPPLIIHLLHIHLCYLPDQHKVKVELLGILVSWDGRILLQQILNISVYILSLAATILWTFAILKLIGDFMLNLKLSSGLHCSRAGGLTSMQSKPIRFHAFPPNLHLSFAILLLKLILSRVMRIYCMWSRVKSCDCLIDVGVQWSLSACAAHLVVVIL